MVGPPDSAVAEKARRGVMKLIRLWRALLLDTILALGFGCGPAATPSTSSATGGTSAAKVLPRAENIVDNMGQRPAHLATSGATGGTSAAKVLPRAENIVDNMGQRPANIIGTHKTSLNPALHASQV